MHTILRSAALAFALMTGACATAPAPASSDEAAGAWVSLFDGESLAGWRNFRSETADARWVAADGVLEMSAGGAGDLITVGEYENFELAFEWRMSEGGNSGVMFNVVEADHGATYFTGPEYQLLDDARHADGADPTHRAGANYDLHAPRIPASRPIGEWNEARLIVNRGHVEHWLNGERIVSYELWSPEWEALVAESKFTQWPAYGRAHRGHIALQDHGDKVWFRNLRIREL